MHIDKGSILKEITNRQANLRQNHAGRDAIDIGKVFVSSVEFGSAAMYKILERESYETKESAMTITMFIRVK